MWKISFITKDRGPAQKQMKDITKRYIIMIDKQNDNHQIQHKKNEETVVRPAAYKTQIFLSN